MVTTKKAKIVKGGRLTRQKSPKEAERTIHQIERDEKGIDIYITKWLSRRNIVSMLASYKRMKERDSMSDSRRFVNILTDLKDEDKERVLLNISKAGSVLCRISAAKGRCWI